AADEPPLGAGAVAAGAASVAGLGAVVAGAGPEPEEPWSRVSRTSAARTPSCTTGFSLSALRTSDPPPRGQERLQPADAARLENLASKVGVYRSRRARRTGSRLPSQMCCLTMGAAIAQIRAVEEHSKHHCPRPVGRTRAPIA